MHFVNMQHLITGNTLHVHIFNVSRCFTLQIYSKLFVYATKIVSHYCLNHLHYINMAVHEPSLQ
jgi:hypothetical protein